MHKNWQKETHTQKKHLNYFSLVIAVNLTGSTINLGDSDLFGELKKKSLSRGVYIAGVLGMLEHPRNFGVQKRGQKEI